MVQVETSQLTAESAKWRETLRHQREALTADKLQLQENAAGNLSRDQLQEVEQLHNQLHIQLINIHDLKHAIKLHERTIAQELAARNGEVRRETMAEHEELQAQYTRLENTLQQLRTRFDAFLRLNQ